MIDKFTDKIWEEIMRTGDNVTSISQLGYPADEVNPMTTPMPNSVAEYLAPNIVQLIVRSNMGNSSTCNWITGSGYIYNLGNDRAMDSGNGYPFIDYASVAVEYNGVLSKFCAFREFDANANANAVDDSVIGSCYNIGDLINLMRI